MIQVKIEIWIIYMYKHGFESNFQWEIATVTLRYHVQKKKKSRLKETNSRKHKISGTTSKFRAKLV